jgi:hypothetical protein
MSDDGESFGGEIADGAAAGGRVEAFTFGDPESVLDRHEMIGLLEV